MEKATREENNTIGFVREAFRVYFRVNSPVKLISNNNFKKIVVLVNNLISKNVLKTQICLGTI